MSDDFTADLLIFLSRIFFLKVSYRKHILQRSKELVKTWGLPRCKNMLHVFFVSSCWTLVIVKCHQKLTNHCLMGAPMKPHILCKNFEIFLSKLYQDCQVHLISSKFQRASWLFGGQCTNDELLFDNRACLWPNMDCAQSPSYTDEFHGIQQYWHCLCLHWLFKNCGQSRRVKLRTFQKNSSL